jgi:hypothetical protein
VSFHEGADAVSAFLDLRRCEVWTAGHAEDFRAEIPGDWKIGAGMGWVGGAPVGRCRIVDGGLNSAFREMVLKEVAQVVTDDKEVPDGR